MSSTVINRLMWRSRRGLLELDLLLPPFIRSEGPRFTAEQCAQYARLLECDDQDIWSWLQGKSIPPDQELRDMIERIGTFNAKRQSIAGD